MTLALVLVTVLLPQSPAAGAPPSPTAADYQQWIAAIEPNATELAYLQVAWRNEFWPAVTEARELGRPILFWTMNGHPLGCT